MSDYDDAAAEQARIDAEYANLCAQYERLQAENARLVADANRCVEDVQISTQYVDRLHKVVKPPLSVTATETDKKQVIANNASLVIDDLVDSYRLLKNESTASKNLTASRDKYYTQYDLYNELRQVSLGYVVGVDKNFWESDAPRKKVEKMYLANTDYWLAYATMAVMLWASDEVDACNRAVSKAMQINERKAALFFLIICLRFERKDAAKMWYKVYFDLVDNGGVGEEIVYILQVLLCGALGRGGSLESRGDELALGATVQKKLTQLLAEASKDINVRRQAQEGVDDYFKAYISVTEKEFLNLKHICAEYGEMIALLGDAEKNAILKDYFLSVLNDDDKRDKRCRSQIYERIEDVLHSLISAHDDAEQELLDKISYEEMVVDANGNIQIARESYDKMMALKKKNNNIALIMVNTALNKDAQVDANVKRFALRFIKDYALSGAQKFASYRNREKREYDFNVDGCKLRGDENSFAQNEVKLREYYDELIKKRTAEDKVVKSLKTCSIILCVLFAIFGVLTAVSFLIPLKMVVSIVSIVLTVLFVGGFAACLYFKHEQKIKIRKSFEFRINNGIKMLEDGLKDLASWRAAYKSADKVHEELIAILKEEVSNG